MSVCPFCDLVPERILKHGELCLAFADGYPRDLGHNFVLAHDACNSRKGDLLAGVLYLERWLDRNATQGAELDRIFSEARMLHDAETSRHVTAWSYEQVERTGGLVWLGAERVEHLGRDWRNYFTTPA